MQPHVLLHVSAVLCKDNKLRLCYSSRRQTYEAGKNYESHSYVQLFFNRRTERLRKALNFQNLKKKSQLEGEVCATQIFCVVYCAEKRNSDHWKSDGFEHILGLTIHSKHCQLAGKFLEIFCVNITRIVKSDAMVPELRASQGHAQYVPIHIPVKYDNIILNRSGELRNEFETLQERSGRKR